MKASSSNFSRDWIDFSTFIFSLYIFSRCIRFSFRAALTTWKEQWLCVLFSSRWHGCWDRTSTKQVDSAGLSHFRKVREKGRETCACTKSAGLNYTFDKISAQSVHVKRSAARGGGSFVRSRANVFFRNSRISERAPIARLCMRYMHPHARVRPTYPFTMAERASLCFLEASIMLSNTDNRLASQIARNILQ